jgi:ubiquinone/menaquinone biosynthesis C-methylase UbiE
LRLQNGNGAEQRWTSNFAACPEKRIPLENRSVDSIVSTFTLGTIPDVLAALRSMGRVLRPGGKFIFFELGLSPDPVFQDLLHLFIFLRVEFGRSATIASG